MLVNLLWAYSWYIFGGLGAIGGVWWGFHWKWSPWICVPLGGVLGAAAGVILVILVLFLLLASADWSH